MWVQQWISNLGTTLQISPIFPLAKGRVALPCDHSMGQSREDMLLAACRTHVPVVGNN